MNEETRTETNHEIEGGIGISKELPDTEEVSFITNGERYPNMLIFVKYMNKSMQ
jgi:hypothetical protein